MKNYDENLRDLIFIKIIKLNHINIIRCIINVIIEYNIDWNDDDIAINNIYDALNIIINIGSNKIKKALVMKILDYRLEKNFELWTNLLNNPTLSVSMAIFLTEYIPVLDYNKAFKIHSEFNNNIICGLLI